MAKRLRQGPMPGTGRGSRRGLRRLRRSWMDQIYSQENGNEALRHVAPGGGMATPRVSVPTAIGEMWRSPHEQEQLAAGKEAHLGVWPGGRRGGQTA